MGGRSTGGSSGGLNGGSLVTAKVEEKETVTETETDITIVSDGDTKADKETEPRNETVKPQDVLPKEDEADVPDEEPEQIVDQEDMEQEKIEVTDVPHRKPIDLFVVIVCGVPVCLFLILWWRGRRITGTVVDANGQPCPELNVKLKGKDSLYMSTNVRGEFAFYNLKKDLYILSIENKAGRLILEAEIYYDGDGRNEDDEIVNVLYSPDAAYKISHFGRKIHIDVEDQKI